MIQAYFSFWVNVKFAKNGIIVFHYFLMSLEDERPVCEFQANPINQKINVCINYDKKKRSYRIL